MLLDKSFLLTSEHRVRRIRSTGHHDTRWIARPDELNASGPRAVSTSKAGDFSMLTVVRPSGCSRSSMSSPCRDLGGPPRVDLLLLLFPEYNIENRPWNQCRYFLALTQHTRDRLDDELGS
jgi:hypothetical protein